MLDDCEYCGHPMQWDSYGVRDSDFIRCSNEACKGEDTLECSVCCENEYNTLEKTFFVFDCVTYCPPCFREMLKDNLTLEKIENE